MVFDVTLLDTYETIRYKPKNKTLCRGVLLYYGEEIASIQQLAIVWTGSTNLVSGRFELEWHRMGEGDRFDGGELALLAEYKTREEPQLSWYIPDLQIMYDGAPLAIRSLSEVIGAPIIFFAKSMEHK
jgi:hypothetical protein